MENIQSNFDVSAAHGGFTADAAPRRAQCRAATFRTNRDIIRQANSLGFKVPKLCPTPSLGTYIPTSLPVYQFTINPPIQFLFFQLSFGQLKVLTYGDSYFVSFNFVN